MDAEVLKQLEAWRERAQRLERENDDLRLVLGDLSRERAILTPVTTDLLFRGLGGLFVELHSLRYTDRAHGWNGEIWGTGSWPGQEMITGCRFALVPREIAPRPITKIEGRALPPCAFCDRGIAHANCARELARQRL